MRKPVTRLNYDPIAATYDRRYHENRLPGVSAALTDLVHMYPDQPVLEVGCGTGHWLAGLDGKRNPVWGLDSSRGMLSQAHKQAPGARLGRATARQLPYANDSFGVIFCVNALHHFDQPQAFLTEAWRAL
ncbi:MAG: class I SAM-dependent methyltransferase, partial [Anaerolineales bacterium]|nr:class I SAM-dependent methyltransferase [Anaerolineales bacterium]